MATLAERLRTHFPEASGRSIKQWLAAGRVRVNGTVARDARAEVARGDKVTLGPPTVAPRARRGSRSGSGSSTRTRPCSWWTSRRGS